MRKWKTQFLCFGLAGLIGISAAGADSRTDTAVNLILRKFEKGCSERLGRTLKSELKIPDDSIYEIDITPEGKTATVIYNNFNCPGGGLPSCGSGGCSFNIIVDGDVFEQFGGRPQSVTIDDLTLVFHSIHGAGCITSGGVTVPGYKSCFLATRYDEEMQTFIGIDR